MTWLYEHRDQLDGHRRAVEIAHSVTYSIPPFDREDLEQQIVLALIEVKKKKDNLLPDAYLWKVARTRVKKYWFEIYRHRSRYIVCNNRGESVAGETKVLSSPGEDTDARLDAAVIVANLPPRLREIGAKRLDGETLTNADVLYWRKQKTRLRPGWKRGLTEANREEIKKLNQKGLPTKTIAGATGWSQFTIRAVLNEAGLQSPWRAQLEEARAYKEMVIKHLLAQGKSITRIAIETHTWKETVREVARNPIHT